jgi:Holliday junction resolvase RusA-like endonuclease
MRTGDLVKYWKDAKEGEPSGIACVTDFGEVGGRAVVWLTGVAGCVSLSHVELAPAPESLYRASAELPGLPDSPNRVRGHWRKSWTKTKKWKDWTALAFAQIKPRAPLHQARLLLTRYSSVQPDPDNLVASFKAVIDGLRQGGVIANDRAENVRVETKWQKAPSRMGKISIYVEEIW